MAKSGNPAGHGGASEDVHASELNSSENRAAVAASQARSVPTVARLRRQQRRIDRVCAGAATVLKHMKQGAALHVSHERGERRWHLSDGTHVRGEIAKIVIADHRVADCGDGLFRGHSQTFRFISE